MEENKPVDPYAKYNEQSNIIAKIIFASRWLQVPIYLGLIVTLAIYSYKFIKGLWALVINVNEMDSNTIMLGVLNLIDVVMIANLLVMVTIGGYEIFVSMSIIGISSIHMLQTFVNASNTPEKTMMWQLLLHLGFLVSAIALAYTDKILYSTSHKTH